MAVSRAPWANRAFLFTWGLSCQAHRCPKPPLVLLKGWCPGLWPGYAFLARTAHTWAGVWAKAWRGWKRGHRQKGCLGGTTR